MVQMCALQTPLGTDHLRRVKTCKYILIEIQRAAYMDERLSWIPINIDCNWGKVVHAELRSSYQMRDMDFTWNVVQVSKLSTLHQNYSVFGQQSRYITYIVISASPALSQQTWTGSVVTPMLTATPHFRPCPKINTLQMCWCNNWPLPGYLPPTLRVNLPICEQCKGVSVHTQSPTNNPQTKPEL